MADKWLSILNSYNETGSPNKGKKISVSAINFPQRGQYTGTGSNGTVEADKASAIDYTTNPPSILHEDEYLNNDGSVTPSNQTMMQKASTEEEQKIMSDMENGLLGYKCGRMKGYQFGRSPVVGGFDTQIPTPEEIQSHRKLELPGNAMDIYNKAKQSGVADRPVPAPVTPKLIEKTATGGTVMQPGSGTDLLGKSQIMFNKTPTRTIEAPKPVVKPTEQQEVLFRKPTREVDVPQVTTPTDTSTPYQAGIEEGLAGIRDVARGESPLIEKQRKETLLDIGAQQAAQRSRMAQELGAAGVGQETASQTLQQLGRSQDVTKGDIEQQFATQELQRQEAAQKDLLTQSRGLSETQFNQEAALRDEQRGQNLRQFETMMDAGDFEGAAQVFSGMYGSELDPTKLVDEYNRKIENEDYNNRQKFIGDSIALINSGYLSETAAGSLAQVVGNAMNQNSKVVLDEGFNINFDDPASGATASDKRYIETVNNKLDEFMSVYENDFLRLTTEHPEFLEDVTPENASKFATVLGTFFAMQDGKPLNDSQVKNLQEYGLYDETLAVKKEDIEKSQKYIGEPEAKSEMTNIQNLIKEGDNELAETRFNQLMEKVDPDKSNVYQKIYDVVTEGVRKDRTDKIKSGEYKLIENPNSVEYKDTFDSATDFTGLYSESDKSGMTGVHRFKGSTGRIPQKGEYFKLGDILFYTTGKKGIGDSDRDIGKRSAKTEQFGVSYYDKNKNKWVDTTLKAGELHNPKDGKVYWEHIGDYI